MALAEDDKGKAKLAYFGMSRGQAMINIYDESRTVGIQAHQSTVAIMEFIGKMGDRLVTCS